MVKSVRNLEKDASATINGSKVHLTLKTKNFEKDGKSKKFKLFATSFMKKRKSVLKLLEKI